MNNKKQKVLDKVISALLILALMVSVSSLALAYDGLDYRVRNKSATYYWGGTLNSSSSASTYKQLWSSAISSWNSAVGYSLTYSSSSSNSLDIYYETSSTVYGVMYPHSVTSGQLTSFSAKVNMGNSENSSSSVFRSTACHELGHTLGLKDEYSGTTIMNVNRNRYNIITPRPIDISNVNSLYG